VAELLRLAAGVGLATGLGAAVLGGPWRRAELPGRLALAWALGLSLLVPLALTAGLAGLPVGGLSLAGLALAAAGSVHLLRRWLRRATVRPAAPGGAGGRDPLLEAEPQPQDLPGEGGASPDSGQQARAETSGTTLVWLSRLVVAAAAALFCWKVVAMPLWSWDHYAIWGVKARRMVAEDRLDLAFLRTQELTDSRPDYPLGLPMAWRVLELGASPSAGGYKLAHVLFGLALLALVSRGLAIVGSAPALANLLTAWAACLPLFWDTETVGLAEMPLVLWAVAAAVLLVEAGAPGRLPGAEAAGRLDGLPGLAPGLVLGFLAWIKPEGRTLALCLLAVSLLVGRAPGRTRGVASRGAVRPLLAGAGAFLALVALERWVAATYLARGVPYLSGDPIARLFERLPQAPELLAKMGSYLAAPEALGLWLAWAGALVLAALSRNRLALALSAVVLAQLGLYVLATFLVYLPPKAHIEASFARITAALTPLAVLAIGAALAGRGAKMKPMRVRLLAFASAADALGSDGLELELPAGSRVADLKARLTADHPALGPLWARLAVAVDGELVGEQAALADGGEVALLPPVSGGRSRRRLSGPPAGRRA
jgi:molybdopterin synthase catalytic subunit